MPDQLPSLQNLNTKQPIALLPVRLETRFTGETGARQLLVRIYPDDIHVDSHEPGLTQEEDEWRKKAGSQLEWPALADRFGVQRAAYILTHRVSPQEYAPESWTRAPYTKALPDYWMALGYRDGKRTLLHVGARLPKKPLAVGPSPDPNAPRTTLVDGMAPVDEGMRWMLDFDAAEEIGMGLRMPLKGANQDGLDRLLVVGVRIDETDPTGGPLPGQDLLTELIDAHHYTSGFALVPQATPTNNTPYGPSGYTTSDPGHEASRQYVFNRQISGDWEKDSVLLAQALGVKADTFDYIENANRKEQKAAEWMNRAMWPATWGYYLEQMLAGTLKEHEADAAKEHFIDHVRARGPLPAIRVGDQPYGVLPATSLEQWGVRTGPDLLVHHLSATYNQVELGWNLDSKGTVGGGWAPAIEVPGKVEDNMVGAGLGVADFTRNGRPDLLTAQLKWRPGEWGMGLQGDKDHAMWNLAASPSRTSKMEVFGIRTADNSIWHRWDTGEAGIFSGWESWGNSAWKGIDISVASDKDGRLTVFLVREDNTIWRREMNDRTIPFHGSLGGDPPGRPVVAMATTPTGEGYWLVTDDGVTYNFGDAPALGGGGFNVKGPIVDAAATPTGKGLWLLSRGGDVVGLGDAHPFGIIGADLFKMAGLAATPDGKGYWMVDVTGKVWAFGTARHVGAVEGAKRPVVGIAACPTGIGYWICTDDGEVYAFGSAVKFGSMAGQPLSKPVTGIAATKTGRGYWMVGADGGIFGFGDAYYSGSMADFPMNRDVVAMVPRPQGDGYWLAGADGGVFSLPGTWSDWLPLHGPNDKAISISGTTAPDGRLYVFCVGPANDVWLTYQGYDRRWSPWQPLPVGVPARRVAAGRNANGLIQVFMLTTEFHLHTMYQTRTDYAWTNSGWKEMPGEMAMRIGVTNTDDGRLALVKCMPMNWIALRTQAGPTGPYSPWEKVEPSVHPWWPGDLLRGIPLAPVRDSYGQVRVYTPVPITNEGSYAEYARAVRGSYNVFARIGRNVDILGQVAGGWSDPIQLPFGLPESTQSATVTLADLNGAGRPDLLLAFVANWTGKNRAYLQIGWNLDMDGKAERWTEPVEVPDWDGADNRGLGLAVADINADKRPELLLFHAEADGGQVSASIRVGSNLKEGIPQQWSKDAYVPAKVGIDSPGVVGVAVADLEASGRPDIVIAYTDRQGGSVRGLFQVGWNLDAEGRPTHWSEAGQIPGAWSDIRGAGIAVAPVNPGTLADLLRGLTRVWQRSLDSVPRVKAPGEPADDDKDGVPDVLKPEDTLVGALGMDAVSSDFAVRSVLGSDYVDYLFRFLRQQIDEQWWAKQEEMAHNTLFDLGVGVTQRHAQSLFGSHHLTLTGPAILAHPNTEGGPNYLDWLTRNGWEAVRNRFTYAPEGEPTPLLYLLLRHAMLLEYASTVYDLAGVAQRDRVEPELVNIHPAPEYKWKTVFERLREPLKSPVLDTGTQAAGEYLDAVKAAEREDYRWPARVKTFFKYCQAIRGLAKLPAHELELLMAESLDLATHRLDAWVTSLATKQLKKLREGNRATYVGGYGWVENLRPAPTEPATDGYVLAPSPAQAATAAILRSAHLSGAGEFSVDLNSRRVRLAQELLDGIRQGQPLGALLGYRFERGLHEGHEGLVLDPFIYKFRELAPMASAVTPEGNETSESIAPRNVVDGMALHSRWKQGMAAGVWDENTIPFSRFGLSGAEYDAVQAELKALDDAVDAVSDTILAEGVYQMVQGNMTRAAAALDVIGKFESPPEMEVVQTPRAGTAVTHRLMVLLRGDRAPGSQGSTPRTVAEPGLAAWTAALLGDLSRVKFRVEYRHGDSPVQAEVSLDQMGIAPLDLVYLAADTASAGQSELDRRLTFYLMQEGVRPESVPLTAGVRLIYGRAPQWTDDVLSLAELLELARAVRKLLTNGRALDGRDLSAPAEAGDTGYDLADLQARADAALKILDECWNELVSSDLGLVCIALQKAAGFGIEGAYPWPQPDRWKQQATEARQQIYLRRQAGYDLPRPDSSAEEQRLYHMARLKAYFGQDFRILPRFTPANPEALTQTFAASEQLQGGDPMQSLTFLERSARVREGAHRLETVLLYDETLGGKGPDLTVGQLPFDGAPWVALPTDGQPIPEGAVSLVVHQAEVVDFAAPIAGLMADEWIEVIPSRMQTAGLAFQYNEPNNRAPQVILLAVAPDGSRDTWSVEMLEAILNETLDLAKLRTVDLDALKDIGHYVPALQFAVNLAGDTVSTDFTAAVRQPQEGE